MNIDVAVMYVVGLVILFGAGFGLAAVVLYLLNHLQWVP